MASTSHLADPILLRGDAESILLGFPVEAGTWIVTQGDLELDAALLPQPPQCWNCRL